MERSKKQLRVIRMHVLLIVDGGSLEVGLRARKLAEEEKKHVPDQNFLWHQTEVENVQVRLRKQILVIHKIVRLTANGEIMVIGHCARKLAGKEKKCEQGQKRQKHQMEVPNVKEHQPKQISVMINYVQVIKNIRTSVIYRLSLNSLKNIQTSI